MKNENAYVIYLIKDIDDNESKIIKVSLIYVLFVSLGIVTAAISGLDNRFSFTHVLDWWKLLPSQRCWYILPQSCNGVYSYMPGKKGNCKII